MSTLLGEREARFLLTMVPAELNNFSEHIDVAGIHKSFLANLNNTLKRCSLTSTTPRGLKPCRSALLPYTHLPLSQREFFHHS